MFVMAAIAVTLTACSAKAPATLERLSEVSVAEGVAPVAAAAPVKQGFFARMMGRAAPSDTDEIAAQIIAELSPEDEAADPEVVVTEVAAQAPATPAPARAGLFGRLLGGTSKAAAAPAPTGPDAQQVSMGTTLPFGVIATNCEVRGRDLGTKVDANAGYTLYDTFPNSTALRTHYITGFKDRCARQFTAATSLMGDIGTHEVVRYLPSNAKMDYSVTDSAYEAIKSSYCRVGHGQPCGAKLDRLAKTTSFITAYERFGSNPSWSNILVHDGGVVAMGPASR